MPTHDSARASDADTLLAHLLTSAEDETLEFKAATTQFDRKKLGRYVSALSNEAHLAGQTHAWLVLGVTDDRTVCGTEAFDSPDKLNDLKRFIHEGVDQGLSVREHYEVFHPEGRVLLLKIPAAPAGMPISWHGHFFARAGESLIALPQDKHDAIRFTLPQTDWTNEVVPGTSLSDLDEAALKRARQGFTERHSPRLTTEEVGSWSDEEFLTRARLMRDGLLTRAALILLGGVTAAARLDGHPAELTWRLRGEQEAYEHFYPPLLLTAGELAARIRNVKLRLMPPDELMYREVSKYEERSILEALYNCIAHQDYSHHARVIVTELPDRLEFTNSGTFFDGDPSDYISDQTRTPRRYRNPALAQAMQTLNLVDRMGYGIQRMVDDQLRRFMPLPDYIVDPAGEVTLTLHGAVIDEHFSQLLMARSDLPFEDVLALDRVQKGLAISSSSASRLRAQGLVEGRRPRLRITAHVAAQTDSMATYVRTRPQADTHYATMLLDYVAKNGGSDRRGIDELLLPLLPDVLSEAQKKNKVSNLISKLRRAGSLENRGSRGRPWWVTTGEDLS